MVVSVEHQRAKARERQARRRARLSDEQRRAEWRTHQAAYRARRKLSGTDPATPSLPAEQTEETVALHPANVSPPPPLPDDEIDALLADLDNEESPAEPEAEAQAREPTDEEFGEAIESIVADVLAEQRKVTLSDPDTLPEAERPRAEVDAWRNTFGL